MDSKELNNPEDTYNAIKKDLVIDLPYKDYIQKLRQDSINRNVKNTEKELNLIKYVRLYNKESLKEYDIEKIKKSVNEIYSELQILINYNYANDVLTKINAVLKFILIFNNNIAHLIKLYDEYVNSSSFNSINNLKTILKENENTYYEFVNLSNEIQQTNELSSNISTKLEIYKNNFYNQMQKYLDIKDDIKWTT